MGFETDYPHRKDWRKSVPPSRKTPPPEYSTAYRYKSRKLLAREHELRSEYERPSWMDGLTEDEIMDRVVQLFTNAE